MAERLLVRAEAVRIEDKERAVLLVAEAAVLANEAAALVRLRFETRTVSLVDAVLDDASKASPPAPQTPGPYSSILDDEDRAILDGKRPPKKP